ncbi:hypothetical protein V2J09_014457 [Rumex salicifolius]
MELNDGSSGMPTEALYASVDPFLIEVLQDFRHRLTVLRMELDVQMFLQNPEQLQFEFPHFPSSYMRLAAHRVAHHYGLQTVVVDNGADALGKIVAMKTPESKYASVCLSEIPAKQPDTGKMEQKKIAIRRRPSRTSSGEADDLGAKHSPARTVEERKEQYDKARARIFNNPGSPTSDDTSPQVFEEDKNFSTNKDDGVCQSSLSVTDADITPGFRDFGSSSRVAIFKDREKDLTDPDYDRSYDRYIKSFPVNQRPFVPFNMPSFQPPMVQYNPGFSQMGGQMPRPQSSINYAPSSDLSMNQFGSLGINHLSRDAMYMQWPNPTMMYAHTYEPFRHAVFQAPFCQQPLSFDYAQNHH